MKTNESYDYLNLKKDSNITRLLRQEVLIFSDKITKINKYRISQNRIILITNEALYNFKKTDLKRRFDFKNLRGITISNDSDEFVVHGNNIEHDYYFISNKKRLIIEIIADIFRQVKNEKMTLCLIVDKPLFSVVTQENEKKKDLNLSKMRLDTIISLDSYLLESKGNNIEQKKMSLKKVGTLFSAKTNITEVSLSDFKQLNIIGRGTFGKVILVEYNLTKELMAMKSLKKDVLLDFEQLENTILEKKILANLDHPFLINLIFCFQTEERIYFVLPFIPGGELFLNLKKFKIYDDEKIIFYSSQIGIALEYLHSKGIIYRDIKPENVLMDSDGYLKLTDFGLAKEIKLDEKAETFCGTPEYLSPEIIIGEGYNFSTDWWSFGILIYEMAIGRPPFCHENVDIIYEMIRYNKIVFPSKINLSPNLKDLILRLLEKNPQKRLGSKEGFTEIRQHPFYKEFNFDLLLKKEMKAPFIPVIDSKYDVQNFDKDILKEDPSKKSVIPIKSLENIKKNQDKFKEFDNN